MIDIEQLLAPVSADRPCGEDLSFSPEVDAIAQARKADDPSIEQGAWVTTLKEADWKFVARRCAQLIAGRSKDLQLAVWLAEASARTDGLRGLGDSLLLIGALCQRYWDGLHPLPDEGGFEQRIGNLCWIAGRIAQLVREAPVTQGAAYSMIDVGTARARGAEAAAEIEAARRASSRGFCETLLQDCDHCAAALGGLERDLDARLGQEGPSFAAPKAALQEVIDFVTAMARETGALPAAKPESQAVRPVPTLSASVPAGPIQDRAQALAQLRSVAEFFRRTEPHSPVAYLADKAANWGEQPLHVWLRAVVKDDASLARLEELLGVDRNA